MTKVQVHKVERTVYSLTSSLSMLRMAKQFFIDAGLPSGGISEGIEDAIESTKETMYGLICSYTDKEITREELEEDVDHL